jgi:hypothetical protein
MLTYDTNIIEDIISEQKSKEEECDIWKNSIYKNLRHLQANNVGVFGEKFVERTCNLVDIRCCCDGTKTRLSGCDGEILGINVEIKTALQGSKNPSFQHELGLSPWFGAKFMIFVDIAPDCIYLTIFKNFDEITYKSKKKLLTFPTKTITQRSSSGTFKLDTTVVINEENIKCGNCIKINKDTVLLDIKKFITAVLE